MKSGMLHVHTEPFVIEMKESCGLAHEAQVIEVDIPSEIREPMILADEHTNARFPLQPSRDRPGIGFLFVRMAPFQRLKLVPVNEAAADELRSEELSAQSVQPCVLTEEEGIGTLSNGLLSVQVPLEERIYAIGEGRFAPGPVLRLKAESGKWRGHTFFDTREEVRHAGGVCLESSPLRIHYRYRAEIGTSGYYEADMILDAGREFARVHERFDASSGDQLVWDFGPDHVPETLYLLDATAGYTMVKPQRFFDQRYARLAGWTQFSQLFDLSDGYAVRFREGDAAGFVALEGGDWRGGRLNHIELWARRWWKGDPGSRRDVPPEAKADGNPSPERIATRGEPTGEPHMSAEAWISRGSRRFALVAASAERILPLARSEGRDDSGLRGCSPALGHFEIHPDRERYRRQQGLLRKIHTQYGIMPLQAMCAMVFEWPPKGKNPAEHRKLKPAANTGNADEAAAEEQIRVMVEYLEARVYGFWEGSGSAYTNVVVGRRIAPEMLHYEWLAADGRLSEEQLRVCRAHFIFLAYLFASDHYYPGLASMLPVGDPDALDPALAGMTNQNFYTDAINVPGTAAQVFRDHPEAEQWRSLFMEMWHRQLQVHMYPESGVWEESHTYYQHVLLTVLPTLLRRKADGADDEFANPDMRKLVGSALKQVTPRISDRDGRRQLVAFGDHEADPDTYGFLYAAYAEAFAEQDPELAGQLYWLFKEMGGEVSPNHLKWRKIPAVRPEWRSEYVQGLGFMFRGTDASGHETLLALRSGSAWGHHHNDDASIQFFAKGRALVVDSAFGSVQVTNRKKFSARGHSRWMPRDFDPIGYLWRFNRGWLVSHDTERPFPYAAAYSPVYMHTLEHQQYVPMRSAIRHTRTIVLLAPEAYLIVDAADTELPQTVRFHISGTAVCIKEGEVHADYEDGCWLRLVTLFPDIVPSADPEADRPAKEAQDGGLRYATSEIRYDSQPERSFFAFLLAAGFPGEITPSIIEEKGVWRLTGEAFDVLVRFPTAGEIVVTDPVDGSTRTIRITDTANF